MFLKYVKNGENSAEFELSGRIDTNNSNDFYEEIIRMHQEYPGDDIYLDAENFEYISSAGLRALHMLQKNNKIKLHIFNASEEIAGIFSITGFDQIMDIKKAYQKISLTGLEVIGQGANGIVYRISNDKIVKVYNSDTSLDDINREREMSQKTFFKGISTAIAYDVVRCEENFGLVYEMLNTDTLSSVLRLHPEKYETYLGKYVDVYRSFHETNVGENEFPSIKDVYYGYIDYCKDWYSDEELDKLRRLVSSVPDRNTLIHGDYHPRNIMVVDGELLMIDMGDVSRGHPVFDFLATAATQANLVDIAPDYAVMLTDMPLEIIKRLWNDLLRLYFADKTEDEIRSIDKQVRLFSKLKVAVAPAVGRRADKKIIKASVEDAKANLLPYIDDLIGSINW